MAGRKKLEDDARPEADPHFQYLKERHSAHVNRRNTLDERRFQVCETYDRWVLTLSGGALAISLTFLEKIAPTPAQHTLYFLGISWIAYTLALLFGFSAIYFSNVSIREQHDIDDAVYEHFRKTTTPETPLGEPLPPADNMSGKKVDVLNTCSLFFLISGTILMCLFAFFNVSSSKKQQNVLLLSSTNAATGVIQVQTNGYNSTNQVKP